ncbi:hypothetical protein Tco_0507461 [Tanacetum coccineum]
MNIPPPGKSMIHQLSVKFDHLPKSKEHRLLKEENHYHEGSESGEEVENDLASFPHEEVNSPRKHQSKQSSVFKLVLQFPFPRELEVLGGFLHQSLRIQRSAGNLKLAYFLVDIFGHTDRLVMERLQVQVSLKWSESGRESFFTG